MTDKTQKLGDVAASARKLLDIGANISIRDKAITIKASKKLGIKMLGYCDHVCRAYGLRLVRS
jgi:hypothetical protein